MSRARAVTTTLAVAALMAVGAPRPSFAGTEQGPPPIPPVESVTAVGSVAQNPVIDGRDGTFSTLFQGRSIWTFGDTSMSVPGVHDTHWDDNSMSWTTNLDASQGIDLDHDWVDSTGAPAEFLPYTKQERRYNYTHDSRHCTASPCGAEFAMWPGPPVADTANDRVLYFYGEIWRAPNYPGWKSVGVGIAVGTPGGGVVRPIEDPGSRTPTLMWGNGELGYDNGALVDGDTLYAYGCAAGFLVMNCDVGRVPVADALEKSSWRYYAGGGRWSPNESDAVTVFQGGAAGTSVFYDAYLGEFVAIYNGVYSNDVYYRVSDTPWGPWSDQALLFTGEPGWNGNVDYAGNAHPEFAENDGQIQYVTYVHATGYLRSDIQLVRVTFGSP